jgi:hypothetical protein
VAPRRLLVEVGEHILSLEHDYPDLGLSLHAYSCGSQGEPVAREHVELRWLAPAELLAVPWSEADRRLAEALAARGG